MARTAYKNNSSKYTINGRASNYKEVQTLPKGRDIDLDHNRFLILQVCFLRHEDGFLESLEDIIGTSQYKGPIVEALVEMECLTEDRTEKLNRLRLVECDRNSLEKEKCEAENYLGPPFTSTISGGVLSAVSEEVKQEIVCGLLRYNGTVLIPSSRSASKRNLLRNMSEIRMILRIWCHSKDIMQNAFRLSMRYV